MVLLGINLQKNMIIENTTLYVISTLLPYIHSESNCATVVQPGQCISLQAFHAFHFSLLGNMQCNFPRFLSELLNLQLLPSPCVALIVHSMMNRVG